MATEEDLSVILNSFDSIEISSTQTSRKNTSKVYEYCRKPTNEEPVRDNLNRKIYYYSYSECSYSASITTNFRKHLFNKHNIQVEKSISRTKAAAAEQLQELWRQASTENQLVEFNAQILKSVLNKEVLIQALINLIIVRNLPFRAVEWPEFHAFCQALNPESTSYITTTHSEVSKAISESF